MLIIYDSFLWYKTQTYLLKNNFSKHYNKLGVDKIDFAFECRFYELTLKSKCFFIFQFQSLFLIYISDLKHQKDKILQQISNKD